MGWWATKGGPCGLCVGHTGLGLQMGRPNGSIVGCSRSYMDCRKRGFQHVQGLAMMGPMWVECGRGLHLGSTGNWSILLKIGYCMGARPSKFLAVHILMYLYNTHIRIPIRLSTNIKEGGS